jgi:hypothetical protein
MPVRQRAVVMTIRRRAAPLPRRCAHGMAGPVQATAPTTDATRGLCVISSGVFEALRKRLHGDRRRGRDEIARRGAGRLVGELRASGHGNVLGLVGVAPLASLTPPRSSSLSSSATDIARLAVSVSISLRSLPARGIPQKTAVGIVHYGFGHYQNRTRPLSRFLCARRLNLARSEGQYGR